ncbi:HPP family protein [Sphingomonas histidinilytica]|uniref:HPP family protein n=1 Tax=Rhizorhabdus histidinilytica TaxID=439228 RepID=UPI001ADBE784|nr:HPP family protein [Rhizorhabdus histidinilytica]MBO9378826.1 HPP family protein [Rhizorhabdus histidinilytica]
MSLPKAFAASNWRMSPSLAAIAAAIGGGLAILALAKLQSSSSLIFLLPAFGSTSILVFVEPESSFSRPTNVIGGHFVSSIAGLAAMAMFGHGAIALAVGLAGAILGMLATRTLHPPAGSNPLAIVLSSAPVSFLFQPVLVGTVAIVLIGLAYHRIVTKRAYPVRAEGAAASHLRGRISPVMGDEDVRRGPSVQTPCACSLAALERRPRHNGIGSATGQKR